MPLLGGSTYTAIFKGFQAGQIINNILRWDSTQDVTRVLSYFVASYLDTYWRENVIPLLSSNFFYTGLEILGAYESGNSSIEGGLLPGDLAGDVLPAFLAAGCLKYVLPTGQEGVDAGQLTYGHMRLAGIPEAVQNNGNLTDGGWSADLNTALAGMLTITGLSGQTEDLHMTVVRLAPGGGAVAPAAIGIVGAFQFQRFSTQNTRKR